MQVEETRRSTIWTGGLIDRIRNHADYSDYLVEVKDSCCTPTWPALPRSTFFWFKIEVFSNLEPAPTRP